VEGKMRRFFLLLIILIISFSNVVIAQSPPFSTITISGTTDDIYDKVSLFESGSSKIPIKTEDVSSGDGNFSIAVDIQKDMRQKGDYFYTDMRFWQDENSNGTKDSGEKRSECHFIIWVPASNKVYLQVYKGPKYEIDSSLFEYNYK